MKAGAAPVVVVVAVLAPVVAVAGVVPVDDTWVVCGCCGIVVCGCCDIVVCGCCGCCGYGGGWGHIGGIP